MKFKEVNSVKKTIANFKHKKILVLGDLILDEFIWGDVSRISPEAPVPVVWAKRESFIPGGACNVAGNISALGAKAYVVGLIGDDTAGSTLLRELEHSGIDTGGILIEKERPTTLKTRVVAHRQQVVRIDKEQISPLSEKLIVRLAAKVKALLHEMDALIIEDYGKGVVSPSLLRKVCALAKARRKVVAVDPKEEHFESYKEVSLITPNQAEASKAVGFAIHNDEQLRKAGKKIFEMLNCKMILITLGEKGMCLFQKGFAPKLIPTMAQEVYDVSGAGDTVIATFTLAFIAGLDPIKAAKVANCAAGIVVGKFGTAAVSPEELVQRIK